jgi:hypothetical protein
MSLSHFGIGLPGPTGYGDADSWGGPVNGIEVESQMGGTIRAAKDKLPTDSAQFIVIVACLALLWVLGGAVFGSARM